MTELQRQILRVCSENQGKVTFEGEVIPEEVVSLMEQRLLHVTYDPERDAPVLFVPAAGLRLIGCCPRPALVQK